MLCFFLLLSILLTDVEESDVHCTFSFRYCQLSCLRPFSSNFCFTLSAIVLTQFSFYNAWPFILFFWNRLKQILTYNFFSSTFFGKKFKNITPPICIRRKMIQNNIENLHQNKVASKYCAENGGSDLIISTRATARRQISYLFQRKGSS